MTIGVYGIFIENDCLYIGKSKEVETRWKRHKSDLINNKHSLRSFNNWFKTSGVEISNLRFLHLENFEVYNEKKIREKELDWFLKLSPKFYGVHPNDDNFWAYDPITKKSAKVQKHFRSLNLTREKIAKLYYEDKLSITELADLWGCSVKTVYVKFKKFGIKTHYEIDKLNSAKLCITCNKKFNPVRKSQKSCSKSCGGKAGRIKYLNKNKGKGIISKESRNLISKKLTGNKNATGNKGGIITAHNRWHKSRDIFSPNCTFCLSERNI